MQDARRLLWPEQFSITLRMLCNLVSRQEGGLLVYSVNEAMKNRSFNKGGTKYPDSSDKRFQVGMLFPNVVPGFTILPGQRVFTIGSCFARNIERKLGQYDVPTSRYCPPDGDPLAPRASTVLNEYNPGCISQRIMSIFQPMPNADAGIHFEDTGYCDHFITGTEPASLEIVQARRKAISDTYSMLLKSDLLIVTLGMTEAWYDTVDDVYLNRAPSPHILRNPELAKRFQFRVLDLEECVSLLRPAFKALFEHGLKNILLTVSPVPLQRSFSRSDAVVANMSSKATLRVACDQLCHELEWVEYFPSYEMITTFAGNSFISDNVHVRDELVERVTNYMMESYQGVA